MKHSHRLGLLALAVTLLAVACSKADAPSASGTTAPSSTPAASPAATPAAPAAPAPTAAAPAGAAAPVDVCALITQAEVKEALGAEVNPGEAKPAQGSFLGGCDFFSMPTSTVVSVSARPANEWDATVSAYQDLAPVSGVGQAAHHSKMVGMLVQPADKPYFLQVLAAPANDQAVLKKVAEKAL